MEVTREWICEYIRNQPREKVANMVGRALVALFRRQTLDEQVSAHTRYDNDRGFTAADAESGTIGAKTFIRHGRFTADWQWERWIKLNTKGIPRIAKYVRQLNEIAQERAQ